ncbi:hypothetical protein P4H83_18195 [Paenibacillus favisporus]|uniref:hypothetical protein n=1 Tax=Paenibacillus TaxID=44249 RepID=UPI0011AB4933|nr:MULTISPECIES: hypothetical protein [Paenibacillus]MEC0176808.1 hypothetical protein [Paenibacillus favisporus]
MNKDIDYIKKRLTDLQQYINRELEQIIEEVKRLVNDQEVKQKIKVEMKSNVTLQWVGERSEAPLPSKKQPAARRLFFCRIVRRRGLFGPPQEWSTPGNGRTRMGICQKRAGHVPLP